MSFPRYERYKDSGVEWLGEVPEHWEGRRVGHFAVIAGGGTPSREKLEYWNGDIPWVSPKDMKSEKISTSLEFITDEGVENSTTEIVPSGSVLLVIRSGILKHSIPIGINIEPVAINQDLKSFLLDQEYCMPSFFQRWVQGLSEQLRLYWMSEGATVESFNLDRIKCTLCPLPPIAEQTTIAAFLDHETAKIDALVEEQRRLIGLLKEKRQAVISHAVTKGLNPDAPMKDSGVEWLGEVPEHWDVVPLKYLVKMLSGGTPTKTREEYWEGTIPWASSKDLKVNDLTDTQDHISQLAVDDGSAKLIESNSILIVVRGMILAHTFPVTLSRVPMAINQDLKAIQPSKRLNVEYLTWYLRGTSLESLGRVDNAAHGTTVLRMDDWANIEVAFPKLEEQQRIAELVQLRYHESMHLIRLANQAICSLQERRTALISAAVTGKIDVRNHAPTSEGVPA